ncbi:3'-5'-exoribonuclease [Dimargaris verticillata]|uniref:3'-5'-exoribonuclease n=1 Tax=Dimargaris verticillata TaxID=2761393 RepID=A0A9W8B6H0_9FUNG|nr:3'-5'-exoribonuclease [Dimargaris verticillata]
MDRRHVTGPERSVAPLPAGSMNEAVATTQAQTAMFFDTQRNRQDGRTIDAMRPIFLKTGLINQASGSAYFEQNNIRVACGVYGPRQNTQAQFNENARLDCGFKFATFACDKRRQFQRDPEERELSQILIQALTPAVRLGMYPKSTIDIYVTVIQSDGWWSTLAAAITCASVALVDAGIDVIDIVTASAVLVLPDGNVVDATQQEEQALSAQPPKCHGSLVVAQLPTHNEIAHVVQTGKMTPAQLTKAIDTCLGDSAKVHSVVSYYLREAVLATEPSVLA